MPGALDGEFADVMIMRELDEAGEITMLLLVAVATEFPAMLEMHAHAEKIREGFAWH